MGKFRRCGIFNLSIFLIIFCTLFIFGVLQLYAGKNINSSYNLKPIAEDSSAKSTRILSTNEHNALQPPSPTMVEPNVHPTAGIMSHFVTASNTTSIASNQLEFHEINKSNKVYSINLPGCKIVRYRPFNAEVIPFYKKVPKLKCGVSFAFADGKVLHIDKDGMSKHFEIPKDAINCTLHSIERGLGGYSDNQYKTKVIREILEENYTSTHEFLKVECSKMNNSEKVVVYDDMFAFIQNKEKVEERCKNAIKRGKVDDKRNELFSIVIIGLDSVSHLNFLRQLPSTYHYIKENFDPMEYQGYTKLGHNTFPSLLPLLTGKEHHELESPKGPFDDEPFIWKNFSALGYRTQFAEDWPSIAIFNYLKRGFHVQPTDYYLRPFYLAAGYTLMSEEKENCFHSREEISVLLQWVKDFIDAFKSEPLFSFSFSTKGTHNELNNASFVDGPMTEFFRWFRDHPKRNKTFLILFSDHGVRGGPFRNTNMGSIEDRLPLFLLIVPAWFRKKYPQHYHNLQQNQFRLMTLFDVHEMLKDLLNFTGVPRPVKPSVLQRGISLFDAIPVERTCDDAGISPQFCVCREQEYTELNSSLATYAAEELVKLLNNITNVIRYTCAILKLRDIKSFSHHEINRRSRQNTLYRVHSLKLRIETIPGRGLFEGVVLCDTDKVSTCRAELDIERINSFGKQAYCIWDDSKMQEYCYCVHPT